MSLQYHNPLVGDVMRRIRTLSDTGRPWRPRDAEDWLADGLNSIILRYKNRDHLQAAYRIPWPTNDEPHRVMYLPGAGGLCRQKFLPGETLCLLQTDHPEHNGFVDLSSEGIEFITWSTA